MAQNGPKKIKREKKSVIAKQSKGDQVKPELNSETIDKVKKSGGLNPPEKEERISG